MHDCQSLLFTTSTISQTANCQIVKLLDCLNLCVDKNKAKTVSLHVFYNVLVDVLILLQSYDKTKDKNKTKAMVFGSNMIESKILTYLGSNVT